MMYILHFNPVDLLARKYVIQYMLYEAEYITNTHYFMYMVHLDRLFIQENLCSNSIFIVEPLNNFNEKSYRV